MALGSSQAPASFDHAEKTSIGATALQLLATSLPIQVGIEIKAAVANGAGIVYVGNSDVTAGGTDATDGFALAAGLTRACPSLAATVSVVRLVAGVNVTVVPPPA